MIGGNVAAVLQIKNSNTKNAIGERVTAWSDLMEITGWLDLSNGDSNHNTFNTKLQESTHVFLCDYVEIAVRPEKCRLLIDHTAYEVLVIDDPMGMRRQVEIYLKYVGGQDGI